MADHASVVVVQAEGETDSLTATLGRDGWLAVRAGTAAEAIERARQERSSALIFRGAPGEGLALVKKLRCNARTALLPVIMIGNPAADDRAELERWGVTSVLPPDTDDQQIADAVRLLAPVPRPAQAPDSALGREARLTALERTRLLDSPPEEPFDTLARFIARLLDVPVVLLSVVDRQRQFFKAQVGLPEPLRTTRETSITHSFCQWVVTGDDALVVDDARRDVLLATSRATTEMGIVAYAGVPIRVESNETIGSFCAVDMKARHWDALELRALDDVALVVRGLTEVRRVQWLAPRTLEEFRALAGAAGRAVEAATRLYEAGRTRVDAAELQALLAIAGSLGRDLGRV